MRTVINEKGCETTPHGSPSLEVTIPFVLQGMNVKDLLVSLIGLVKRVEQLEAALKDKSETKQEEPLKAPVEPVKVKVEQEPTPVVEAPVEASVEPTEEVLEPAADTESTEDSEQAPSKKFGRRKQQ